MTTEPAPALCNDCPVHLGVDHLTGTQSRAVFMVTLQQRLARDERATLLLLDLDGFKQVNDRLGHPAGDALLRAAAERIRRTLRPDDALARLGGDEFAVLLPAMTDADIAQIAGRIVNLLSRPFMVGGRVAHVGVSIGCARAPGEASEALELVRMADLALYDAKVSGGGRTAFASSELRDSAAEAQRLETDLRAALALEQLSLAYQPQYDLATGRLSGFEALMRWNHPIRGRLGPDVFIPLMERSRLIVEAGAWAIHQAAIAAQDWGVALGLAAPPRMAVNVSAAQIESGQLVSHIAAALNASGTDPRSLEIEVTESVLLRRSATTFASLRELQAMGIEIALDDFGTGYSSLSLLHAFEFDRLKIDRSFLRDDGRGRAILASVARLARGLGMRTTAEGVETPEQLARLRELGCTDVQGFLTGRPVPPGTLVARQMSDFKSNPPAREGFYP